MKYFLVILSFLLLPGVAAVAQLHPGILMTAANAAQVREGCEKYPLLKESFAGVKADADEAIAQGINVPVPKDAGGGITHEQHKYNYQAMVHCGIAWQVTQDKKYAKFVQDMLLAYAAQYENWPLHPARKGHQHAGKIFWQNLNDCVWGVYTAMAYDLVWDAIPQADRQTINDHLFKPEIKFLAEDNKETFDWIHNHGTWCLTAVGLTSYVLGDKEYAARALNGSARDNKTGYLAQLDQLFSPDGYYNEGPYYQRYAILPFILFAKAVQHYQPEVKIYQYRNGVLGKAVQTALQLTYTNGALFPVNDAMKDKTYESEELVFAADIAYADITHSADLLDVSRKQNRVIVSDAGLQVAKDIVAGKALPFKYTSQVVHDGKNGDEGGIGILRYGTNADQQCLVLKAAAHGMGHGHFDNLNILYYDNGTEVFSDYGAARFINIATKSGGDYLPENKTFARQTIAHNTVTVDEQSQNNAKQEDADLHHADIVYFNNTKDVQVISAIDTTSNPGVKMQRTVALVKTNADKPLLISVYKLSANTAHQYDLPFWYQGQITNISYPVHVEMQKLVPLGKKNGYQHLWENASDLVSNNSGSITVLNNHRFYTTSFITDTATRVALVTSGANDTSLNLRTEKAFILRQPATGNYSFVSITEAHGRVDPVSEMVTGYSGNISELKWVTNDNYHAVFSFIQSGKTYTVTIHYNNKESFFQLNGK